MIQVCQTIIISRPTVNVTFCSDMQLLSEGKETFLHRGIVSMAQNLNLSNILDLFSHRF